MSTTLRYAESKSWLERAKQVLACDGAQTLSKQHIRFPEFYPNYAHHGNGAWFRDVDGNAYIDYVLGLGPLILGWKHPAVQLAVLNALDYGPVFSLDHPLTVEVAEMLVDAIPCAEMVRFAKTGSTANDAALRVARTYTGRDMVLVASNSYHGTSAWFQACQTGRGPAGVSRGLKESIAFYEYNDADSLERQLQQYAGDVAAVFVEPARTFTPAPGYLERVRELCTKHGAVLIFDEVVTGFRFALGGAQEYYGVTPDLSTVGKAMSNGYSCAAVVGQRDIMQAFDRCFFSGTYHAETIGLAAAKATIKTLSLGQAIPHIWEYGHKLRAEFARLAQEYGVDAQFIGTDVCSVQVFGGDPDNILKSIWLEETALHGVCFGTIQYVSNAHKADELEQTKAAMEAGFARLRQALDSGEPAQYLQGAPIGAPLGWPLERR